MQRAFRPRNKIKSLNHQDKKINFIKQNKNDLKTKNIKQDKKKLFQAQSLNP